MLSTSTIERFGGIARLYGTSALARFQSSHVCVVGIGGVGSWAVEALARSGIGKITLIDLDDVCITNVNRQLHAMDGEIGKQKTEVMAQRVNAINPDCEVICEPHFYSKKKAEQLLSPSFDYLIDAIDLLDTKAHLIAECHKRHIPVIACGGVGGLTDPTRIEINDLSRAADGALLKKVRTRLRQEYNFPKGRQKKIKRFGIECIFSSEQPVFPTCDGEVSTSRDTDQEAKLNCTSGFGSVTHMTATVGLYATQRCLHHLASSS